MSDEIVIPFAPDLDMETLPAPAPVAGSTASMNGNKPTAVAGWPKPLAEAAYHGVAGDVVRTIEPETESDPAAILVQFLTVFGAACGRGPGFRVEADWHGVNLYTAIVGESAIARKGSSLGQAAAPVMEADPTLKKTTGLSSGEGLIWEIRDPIEKRRKARKDETGDEDGYVTVIEDEGIPDKRLLITETEFASVLTRMGRDGNTVSPVLRQSWDGLALRVMTKGSPATATDPHGALVAHITLDELQQKLNQVDTFNGFANRFLWVCARRSRSLPRGGKQLLWRDSKEVDEIRTALRFAGAGLRTVELDDEAGELWDAEYDRLCTGRDGLLAAVTNRAPAQTRRIATIYALLDCSPTVKLDHLEAAFEVWRYCEDSCRYLFGDSTGDPVADEILGALRARKEEGMTRTEIRDLFGRNIPADRVERALVVLILRDLARMEREETGGRPAERWSLK